MNVNDFLDGAAEMSGFIMASLTDEYILDTWPMNTYSLHGKEDKVLEIRIFNRDKEEKIFRTDLSKDFLYTVSEDSGKDYFDECQYIDIDTKLMPDNQGDMVVTTGGGKFNLPMEKKVDSRVVIRYYLDRYGKTGHVKLASWRLVDFVSSERG